MAWLEVPCPIPGCAKTHPLRQSRRASRSIVDLSADSATGLFWAKVDTSDGLAACWPWTGSVNEKGYGRAHVHGTRRKARKAHRVAYELAVGPIPDGMVVMHSCDNPPCCNPAHLSVGSVADNQRDMVQKGRSLFGRSRLTPDQEVEVRIRHAAGETHAGLASTYSVHHSTISRVCGCDHDRTSRPDQREPAASGDAVDRGARQTERPEPGRRPRRSSTRAKTVAHPSIGAPAPVRARRRRTALPGAVGGG